MTVPHSLSSSFFPILDRTLPQSKSIVKLYSVLTAHSNPKHTNTTRLITKLQNVLGHFRPSNGLSGLLQVCISGLASPGSSSCLWPLRKRRRAAVAQRARPRPYSCASFPPQDLDEAKADRRARDGDALPCKFNKAFIISNSFASPPPPNSRLVFFFPCPALIHPSLLLSWESFVC